MVRDVKGREDRKDIGTEEGQGNVKKGRKKRKARRHFCMFIIHSSFYKMKGNYTYFIKPVMKRLDLFLNENFIFPEMVGI